jgi:hypothetical protein
MGGGNESTEGVNRYQMNKQKQPLSGSMDGKKEETAYPGRGGRDTVHGKSK